MHNIIRKILVFAAALAMMPVVTAANANSETVVVTLDPSEASPFNEGRFEGWGTSL